jgi:hypothetical protein
MGTNGLAIASLVLGILAVVLSLIPFLGYLSLILAIIFGFIGLSEAKKSGTGKGLAIAGLILGFSALIIKLLFILFIFGMASDYKQSSYLYDTSANFNLPIESFGTSSNTYGGINAKKDTFTASLVNRGPPIRIVFDSGSSTIDKCYSLSLSGLTDNKKDLLEDSILETNEHFYLVWSCDADMFVDEEFEGYFSFDYVVVDTGEVKNHTGYFSGADYSGVKSELYGFSKEDLFNIFESEYLDSCEFTNKYFYCLDTILINKDATQLSFSVRNEYDAMPVIIYPAEINASSYTNRGRLYLFNCKIKGKSEPVELSPNKFVTITCEDIPNNLLRGSSLLRLDVSIPYTTADSEYMSQFVGKIMKEI